MMKYLDVKHLVDTAKPYGVKVTPRVLLDGTAIVCIEDYEFDSFEKARRYLEHVLSSFVSEPFKEEEKKEVSL